MCERRLYAGESGFVPDSAGPYIRVLGRVTPEAGSGMDITL